MLTVHSLIHRYPFKQYQSANAGLTDAAALHYSSCYGRGTSLQHLVESVNDLKARFYGDLSIEHSERVRALAEATVVYIKPSVSFKVSWDSWEASPMTII